MTLLTVSRAAAVAGTAVVGWSMTLFWGDLRGPPPQWERHVVGAVVLLVVATIGLAAVGPVGSRRSWIARGIATAAALGGTALALVLRSDAMANRHEHLLGGAGWTWMLAGSGLAVAGALWALALKPEKSASSGEGSGTRSARSRKNRGRK